MCFLIVNLGWAWSYKSFFPESVGLYHADKNVKYLSQWKDLFVMSLGKIGVKGLFAVDGKESVNCTTAKKN